jgi:predicted DCC family thiol-disulfide oxidoreductase YuxK
MAQSRLGDRLAALPAHSYRLDSGFPRFDDSRPLIDFDGVCVLCKGFARYVLRHDATGRFRLSAAQSALGQALMRHYGIDPDNPETNLLIEQGRAHGKLDAFVRIMDTLGRMRLARAILKLAPGRLADGVYDAIARNRYRLLGRTASCMSPAPEFADRIIT